MTATDEIEVHMR